MFCVIQIWVIWIVKKGSGLASDACPVNLAHMAEIRCAEVERTAIEAYATGFYFPEPATITLVFAPRKQVLVQTNVTEAQFSFFSYYEFLHICY